MPIILPLRRAAVAAAMLLLGAGAAGAQAALPETPAGRQAAALLRAVQTGGEEAVRAFVFSSMTEEFQRIPMEQHLSMFGRMGRDFGGAPVQSVRAEGAERIEVTFAGVQGPVVVRLAVEAAPPHRIADLDVGAGAPPEPEGPPPAVLDAAAQRSMVDSAAALLESFYVAADTGRLIAAHLRARLAGGAYQAPTDAAGFAAALTQDLRRVNGDRHLNARIGTPDVGGRRRQAAGPAPLPEGRYRHLDSVAVLPGNVGYLKLSAIPGAPDAFDEMARALRTLERTDAMVVDLRGSRGGSAQMANFLISHFTRPGLLSLAVASRAGGDTLLRRTLDEVPGPRRLEVPLYVLIDGGAGSASEDIPFVLRNLGRATLVGETTAGAGRNNRFFPLGNGLAMSISITRVWDPCTGREWERVGVAPDLAVPSAGALDAALTAIRAGRGAPGEVPQAACRTAS